MISEIRKIASATALCAAISITAQAEPVTYEIDSNHTFPAFEADHNAGVSVWRGKIGTSSGVVVLDREAETGTVEVEMEMGSIDFGHEEMENAARENILNVAQFPLASYSGTLTDFVNGEPTKVDGMLTMHGVTLDVDLAINAFKCHMHPRFRTEVCGADASTMIDRADFGIDFGIEHGHLTPVKLLISIEAIKTES